MGSKDRLLTRLLYPVILITALLLLAGCATVPLTERKSLNLVPHSQMLSLSLDQYGKVLDQSKLSKDQKKVKMVRRVGKRISGAADVFFRRTGMEEHIDDYEWEFNLIEDKKKVNAWCMPGGKVAVYTGILPYTRNETGLAVVMGHEVAHAMARHGNERMSQILLVNLGGMALSVALMEKPGLTRQLSMAAFGLGASVGILLPYSRTHESEADRIGLTIMAMAGYDPRE
ncbi:MAG: M48 family metallopeptidase, partial [Deltaproteobacteria bacterium]|nr:M48 family metallopeptidase [Deltaproteobacteria bacterium]